MSEPSSPHLPSVVLLDRRLREAAAWCRLRADILRPAESLRSPSLIDRTWPSSNDVDREICIKERMHLTSMVAERRHDLLQAAGISVMLSDPVPIDGFVILIMPDSNWHDECAREVSDGFFDAEELPGQDTWLAYVPPGPRVNLDLDHDSRLIAWIPEVFRDRWAEAKQQSVFDNFDPLPLGTPAAAILEAVARAVESGK